MTEQSKQLEEAKTLLRKGWENLSEEFAGCTHGNYDTETFMHRGNKSILQELLQAQALVTEARVRQEVIDIAAEVYEDERFADPAPSLFKERLEDKFLSNNPSNNGKR